ncbi:hypothetical protein HYH03_004343 [Edaphochlamys debaryana]|uniref:F-box domain-containing protein n=1 Tax=Edaphochlamys debaryana TaxID=47281 RepID=A0A835Y7P6_9CHLO|nr:hypothetical protein HYH03_004343 [Edaphochlamys debaryana]|eukprot:KAG2497598.1 hypothetical protein HYH03_004343 [Edaphochlamys debaryana]
MDLEPPEAANTASSVLVDQPRGLVASEATSQPALASLPPNVWVDLSSRLGPASIRSLRATCRALRISASRSTWLQAPWPGPRPGPPPSSPAAPDPGHLPGPPPNPVPCPSAFNDVGRLELTLWPRLAAADIVCIASACPLLASLRLHRGPAGGLPAPASPAGAAVGSSGVGTGVRPPTGLLGRGAGVEPWPVVGLPFAPLASLPRLRELGLIDLPPPERSRPPGLPREALVSLGAAADQLTSLELYGTAPTLELRYCLSRLTRLTCLRLGVLPEAWEANGKRLAQPTPQSLAALRRLRRLSLALVVAAPPAPSAASSLPELPVEVYGMLLTAPPGALEELELDLPPPALAAALAGPGKAATRPPPPPPPPAGWLEPATLAVSPEWVEVLMRAGMSVRKLKALQLRGFPAAGPPGPGMDPHSWVSWAPARAPADWLLCNWGRHVPAPLVAWTLKRVAAAAAAVTGCGGGGGGGNEAAAVVVGGRDRTADLAAGRVTLAALAAEAEAEIADGPPWPPLPTGMRLSVCLLETVTRLEHIAGWWDEHRVGSGRLPSDPLPPAPRHNLWRCLAQAQALDLDIRILPPPPGWAGPAGPGLGLPLGAGGPAPGLWGPEAAAEPGGGAGGIPAVPPVPQAPYDAARLSAWASGDPVVTGVATACLRWLPCQLPNLYGLSLPYNSLDMVGLELVAAGLPLLRRLDVGHVLLPAAARVEQGLTALCRLRHVRRLCIGGLSFTTGPQPTAGQLADIALDVGLMGGLMMGPDGDAPGPSGSAPGPGGSLLPHRGAGPSGAPGGATGVGGLGDVGSPQVGTAVSVALRRAGSLAHLSLGFRRWLERAEAVEVVGPGGPGALSLDQALAVNRWLERHEAVTERCASVSGIASGQGTADEARVEGRGEVGEEGAGCPPGGWLPGPGAVLSLHERWAGQGRVGAWGGLGV